MENITILDKEVYSSDRKMRLLAKGNYADMNFVIVSYGSHPCTYIEIKSGSKYHGIHYDNISCECHGGLTYSDFNKYPGHHFEEFDSDSWVIGYDYAHAGDYFSISIIPEMMYDHKYTIEELISDVKSAIDSL